MARRGLRQGVRRRTPAELRARARGKVIQRRTRLPITRYSGLRPEWWPETPPAPGDIDESFSWVWIPQGRSSGYWGRLSKNPGSVYTRSGVRMKGWKQRAQFVDGKTLPTLKRWASHTRGSAQVSMTLRWHNLHRIQTGSSPPGFNSSHVSESEMRAHQHQVIVSRTRADELADHNSPRWDRAEAWIDWAREAEQDAHLILPGVITRWG